MNVDQVPNAIRKVGKRGVLRRIVVGGRHRTVQLQHLTATYQAHEMVGGVLEGDQKVFIGNTEIVNRSWPGPPIRGDQIFIPQTGKTGTIQAVETKHLGEEIAMHILQVRGL